MRTPVHVIETYFECGGFDHRFLQGGISVYLWNLSTSLAEAGHRVSVVTPAHGRLAELRASYDLETLDHEDTYELPLVLDPDIWGERFPAEVGIPLTTTAHRLRLDGVDLYFLSNELLDALPDRFYPPYDSKGHDLVFFKSLAYQVDTIRFVRARFGDEKALVHAHEPYYHYLMPAAFRADPSKLVVGTVQSNMPITKKVYRPEVERLLEFLDAPVALPAERPSPSPCAAPTSNAPICTTSTAPGTSASTTWSPTTPTWWTSSRRGIWSSTPISPGPPSRSRSVSCPGTRRCAATRTRASSGAVRSAPAGPRRSGPPWTARPSSAPSVWTRRCPRSSTTPATR